MVYPPQSTSSWSIDQCMELFARYQRRLYLYILSMVPNPTDAEEVLQETNIAVWQQFERYKPGTDFRAWVFQIAFYRVRKHYERRRRDGLSFSNELLDELSRMHEQRSDLLEERRAVLPSCIARLSHPDRQLLDMVYGQGVPVPEIAQRTQRQTTSIYRSLRRIRQLLFSCIESRLGETAR